MNILVTGARGFIGKNLIETLHNIAAGKDRSFGLDTDLTVFEYDVDTDPMLLEAYCKNADFVFNLAGVNRPQDPKEFMEENFGFASTLLKAVEENSLKIDEVITENLVGWTLQRLPKVSLAVLRLAVGEILFNEEVPTNVSVNEAVEIAKTYGTPEDASYINGVLSAIVKKIK